jgi:hypothetical protein
MRALRRSAPGLTRAVVGTLLDPQRRRAVAAVLARMDGVDAPAVVGASRHPMAPAAVRVERTRSRRRRGGEDEQVAVTVWFGEGPSLPGGSRFARGATRVGAGMLSAAAVAAGTALVARLSERPSTPRVVDEPARPAALRSGTPAP